MTSINTAELLKTTASNVVESPENWRRFLETSAHNHKYSFVDQLMIYAQKPDATACASVEIWNKKLKRVVSNDATPIYLANSSSDNEPIVVFDVSDTIGDTAVELPLWEVRSDNVDLLVNLLCEHHNFSPELSFNDILKKLAFEATQEFFPKILGDLLSINSDISNYLLYHNEENKSGDMLRRLIQSSIEYVLLSRCNLDPQNFYDINVFSQITQFNTPEAISVLGTSISKVSRTLLNDISLIVKTLEKSLKLTNNINQSVLKNGEEQSNDEKPGTIHREVRSYEEDLSSRSQGRSVLGADDRREASLSFGGRESSGSRESGTADEADGREERSERRVEGTRPDEVGQLNEQHPQSGRRNSIEGIDLQLIDIPGTFAPSISEVADLENVATQLVQFHEQLHLKNSDTVIKYFNQHTNKEERISFLLNEIYSKDVYCETTLFDGTHAGFRALDEGLELWVGGVAYPSAKGRSVLSWPSVVEIIAQLIDDGRYSTLGLFPSAEKQIENIEISSMESPNFEIAQSDIDAVLVSGSGIENGKSRIYQFFAEKHSSAEKIAFLKDEYGTGSRSPVVFELGLKENHDGNGIEIVRGSWLNPSAKATLSWHQVEKRINELIRADRYLNDAEKEAFLEHQHKSSSDVVFSEDLVSVDIDYDYSVSVGDIVFIGTSKFEVLEIENGVYYLSDVDFPLFTENYSADILQAKLRETPGNDKLTRIPKNVESSKGDVSSRRQLMLEEYNQLKREIPVDCLFYRVGEFYEVMGEDAPRYAEMLGLNASETQAVPVVGIPDIYIEKNIDILRDAGLSCAIADINSDNKRYISRVVSIDVDNKNVPRETFYQEDYISKDSKSSNIQETPQSFVQAGNYHIEDDELGVGGPKEKFNRNVAAIRLLHLIEDENRGATAEEQDVLAQYVGWGGIQEAFDPTIKAWSKEYEELKELLTEEEYVAARESTMTAFYTPPVVIKAIYDAAVNMGFKTGNILEPSCGIGNFMGLLPSEMEKSRIYGIELDSVSGRIAQKLYPDFNIAVQGFEETNLPDSFFDLAVGNVPFGSYPIFDKAFGKNRFLIHDYFFAKTLEKVRPGGIIAFITSKGTMDKKSPEVRKYIAQRAELLGAIRLPDNTFKANAGTEPVSDIIFLQKRDRAIDIEPDWINLDILTDSDTGEILTDSEGSPVGINSYFAEHPEMVLGKMKMVSGPHGLRATCEAFDDKDFNVLLQEAIHNISGNITDYDIDLDETVETGDIPADPNVRNYSFAEVDGALYFRENSVMHPVQTNKTAEQRILHLIELRDIVRSLIDAQLNDENDEVITKLQTELNHKYDTFTKRYGLINSRGNSMAFSDDSSYYLLCSLEHLDKEGNLKRKADMFTKRTIRPVREHITADTSIDALAISIGEKACVDLEYMKELTGYSFDKLTEDLKGSIFPNPVEYDDNGVVLYETADEYLAGNVKKKLQIAKEYAELNPEKYGYNVVALEKVQPEPLTASEISVRLGATWIPVDVYQQFMMELLQPSYYARDSIKIVYTPYTGHWEITNKNYEGYNVKVREEYGTSRAHAYRILEDTLNLKDVVITDTVEEPDGRKRQVTNKEETTIAQQKQQAIKDAFADWVWQDPERRQRLVDIYNDKFNSNRLREFNGDYILFQGMNPEITLMKHQRDAIARILYGGNTLLAHSVGAGKTFEMVAAAMESKRLGLCHKNMFVVPNHLTEQWATEILRLYPSANILVATEKDFSTANRKKFCSRIATGDYDAIVIGHSQFERIPLSTERQVALLQSQLDEIMDGIIEAKEAEDSHVTVKQLERSKKTIQARLDKLNDEDRKDDVVTFEELGVDRIYIDEAHYFKNLFLYTKMQNVAGISQTEAKKSSDLFMKTQYMDEKTGNRGTIFATGTPVSNSMVETYTMQRYLQYDALREMGLEHFDSWASTFGETINAVELAPEGTGYRAKTRFARFYNLPELMTVFKGVADIKTADELDLDVPDVNYHVVSVDPSDEQRAIVEDFAKRAKKVRDGGVEPTEDNMLKITNDGRNLGLDQRCFDPSLPDFSGSKVNACVENIFNIWEKHKDKRLAQLVFCDLSTPHNDGTFSVYDDIKAKLIERGVPEKEIAFIHDANTKVQKENLFGDVRAGNVRILMGSTQKMGAGTNVQDKLIALHDLDCPWRPADLEQRSGRIIRQGNEQDEVEIYRYVTKDTFDAYMWQLVENKQKFISQIMTSKTPVRSAEDVDTTALSYAEIKALATGNPLIKEKMDLDIKVTKLKVLKSNYLKRKFAMEDSLIKEIPSKIKSTTEKIEGYKKDKELISKSLPANDNSISTMVINGVSYVEKDAANTALKESLKKVASTDVIQIGEYRGFKIMAVYNSFYENRSVYLKGALTYKLGNFSTGSPGVGNIDSLLDVDKFNKAITEAEGELDNLYIQKTNAEELVNKPFAQEEELRVANERLNELNALLNNDNENHETSMDNTSLETPEAVSITSQSRSIRSSESLSNAFSPEQLQQIDLALKDGLTGDQMAVVSDVRLSAGQMHYARIGFSNGLSADEVSIYAKPEFSTSQMAIIHDGLHVGGLSIEQVSVYAKPEFTDMQMLQMFLGYQCGLSVEQVKEYANPLLSSYQMSQIRYGFENHLTIEQMSEVIDYRVPGQQMGKMIECLLKGDTVKKPLDFAIENAKKKTVDQPVTDKDKDHRCL